MHCITVNGKLIEFVQQLDLHLLLNQLQINSSHTAIAVNHQVVPKSDWSATLLKDGDEVSVFQMVAGG